MGGGCGGRCRIIPEDMLPRVRFLCYNRYVKIRERFWTTQMTVLSIVAVFSISAGFLAGKIFRENHRPTQAASANIEVLANDESVTQDQSSGEVVMTRFSRVKVTDAEAEYGYALSARLSENTMSGGTVTISSSATNSLCSIEAPCPLTSDAVRIMETSDDAATSAGGETTEWTVKITVPVGVAVGDYEVEVEYMEEMVPDPVPDLGPMQAVTNASCPTYLAKAYDARNSQYYYVKKIGGLCWMLSNLRYAGDGDWDAAWGWSDDRYATAAANTTASAYDNVRPLTMHTGGGYIGGGQSQSHVTAGMVDPEGSTDFRNINPGTVFQPETFGFYGYLYNWCAAMGGQPNSCTGTSSSGFDTAISICPTGWRLPTTGSSSDFQALVNAIGATSSVAGVNSLFNNFFAVYSGYYNYSFSDRGSYGHLSTSTPVVKDQFYDFYFGSGSVYVSSSRYRFNAYAVRCVR